MKQGVEFVIKCFDRMHGGEIFIPMIPSIYITDLATAMAPNLNKKLLELGQEKIHEIMCPVTIVTSRLNLMTILLLLRLLI